MSELFKCRTSRCVEFLARDFWYHNWPLISLVSICVVGVVFLWARQALFRLAWQKGCDGMGGRWKRGGLKAYASVTYYKDYFVVSGLAMSAPEAGPQLQSLRNAMELGRDIVSVEQHGRKLLFRLSKKQKVRTV